MSRIRTRRRKGCSASSGMRCQPQGAATAQGDLIQPLASRVGRGSRYLLSH